MVRRTLAALATTAVLLAALAGQALAVPPHLHCLTTPNGNVHSIARGVTLYADHDTAFHNLHGNVHQGAFADHPLGPLAADFLEIGQTVYTCPPTLP